MSVTSSIRRQKRAAQRLILPRPGTRSGLDRRNDPIVVAGMFRTANGIGRAALGCYEALRKQGLDPLAVDLSDMFDQIDVDSPLSFQPMPLKGPGTLILYANAPETERALLGLGLRRWHKWKIIGAWAWELSAAPPSWSKQTCFLSEIWAPSHFVQRALQQVCSLPVRTVPHYLSLDSHAKAWPTPTERGEKTLRFLTIADGRSSLHRKNILAAIEMFVRAFPNGEPVQLTVKCRNLSLDKSYQTAVMTLASADGRIDVIDRSLPDKEYMHLLWDSDVVVSAHRAEGFGIHLAEAMAAARTTVATGWSGNMEFMTKDNSILLPFELRPVVDPSGIYRAMRDLRWADIDIEAGIRALRDLSVSPSQRRTLGARARNDISTALRSQTYSDALGFPI